MCVIDQIPILDRCSSFDRIWHSKDSKLARGSVTYGLSTVLHTALERGRGVHVEAQPSPTVHTARLQPRDIHAGGGPGGDPSEIYLWRYA